MTTKKTEKINELLEEAYRRGKAKIPYGNVATYIPELGKANPEDLGISICTRDFEHFNIGDTDKRFTIQSISKIVSLAIALDMFGPDKVFRRVDMEPSGEAFNSLIDLDTKSNKPMNPMINSGAITVASMLIGHVTVEEETEIIRKICMDDEITINQEIFESEMNHISRNRAIAYLLESKGLISNVEETLKFYTSICSLQVTAGSLATMGMVFANDGKTSHKGDDRIFSNRTTEIVKTIMLTCGMYDRSGRFAVDVGIPTKSGVGGGLVSVADDLAGIGIYGPALDDKGNCIAGPPALKYLSTELQLHLFRRDSLLDKLIKLRLKGKLK